MSALGQKQTYAAQNSMSALPPIATSNATQGNVRFGPKADIGALAGQYHPAFHPGLEATSLATACANRRAHERAAEACRYPGRRCGGLFPADRLGRGRHAQTPSQTPP